MRLQLTVALLLLAALPTASAAAQGGDSGWRIAADTYVYGDDDNVVVVTPQLAVHRELDEDGGEAAARVVLDVVSAASVDVVSHATTRFDELRAEVDLSVSKAWEGHLPSLGYRYSVEPDYESHGVRAGWQSELGTSDSVLTLGYGLTSDTVGLVGTDEDVFGESLVTHSLSGGLTQVIDELTLVRGVYTLTAQDGYMEKPYRFVPLFDRASVEAANADGVELDLSNFSGYRLPERPPESVPDFRLGHALALRGLRWLDPIEGSVRLDYQLYLDSWGVVAHALEPVVSFHLGEIFLLRPWARLYWQTAADLWERVYVVDGAGRIPRWRTLDRELSTYLTLTGGLRVEWVLGAFEAYAEGSLMHTWFDDFLLLDRRLALVGQAGVRWTP